MQHLWKEKSTSTETDLSRRIRVGKYLCSTNSISVRPFPMQNPDVRIAPAEYEAVVWAQQDPSFVFVYFGQSMTLEMEDGRCLRFFHQDIDGNIVLNEWIG